MQSADNIWGFIIRKSFISVSLWWWRLWQRWEYRIFIGKYENELLKVFPYVEETTKLPKKEPSNKSAKKSKSELILTGVYISKKVPSKKFFKKPKHLYIVPGVPTLFYQQSNHN